MPEHGAPNQKPEPDVAVAVEEEEELNKGGPEACLDEKPLSHENAGVEAESNKDAPEAGLAQPKKEANEASNRVEKENGEDDEDAITVNCTTLSNLCCRTAYSGVRAMAG